MKEETKQAIIEAAIFVFNEDLSAPMEKVAERADMTRRTLHRYFGERRELLSSCLQEMQKVCSIAMANALEISDNPKEQLENLLYAAIDCGVKYSFLHKIQQLHGYQHLQNETDNARYDQTFGKVRMVLQNLHKKTDGVSFITVEWMTVLFFGVLTASIEALNHKKMNFSEIKSSAWYSFKMGINL